MTVRELINELEKFDQKATVKLAYEFQVSVGIGYVKQIKRDGEEAYVVFVSKD